MPQKELVLIAHNIRSIWNVGSLFRTADAFAVSHVHLTGYTAAPPRIEITKTALGAEEWIPWSQTIDPAEVIQKRRDEGYEIVSLEITKGSKTLSEHCTEKPVCLVLGHEVLGVSDELLALSDTAVAIPMLGKKSSLNVSVAAGIALHHYRCVV